MRYRTAIQAFLFLSAVAAMGQSGTHSKPTKTPSAKHLPEMHWSIGVTGKEEKTVSVVYLVVAGKPTYVATVQSCEIKPIDQETMDGWKVPKHALTACFGWYAGAGDIFYVLRHGQQLRIYHRPLDEESKEFKDYFVKSLPLKK